MYAYCNNNPANNTDPTGHCFIKNAYKWLVKTIAKPVVNYLQKKTENTPNITTTTGYSWSAAFGVSAAHSIGITRDMKGNIGVIVTDGAGGGFPTASFNSFSTISTAPTIYEQEGLGFVTGGSVDVAGISVGGEYGLCKNPDTNEAYHSFSVMGGVGAPIPAEFHGEVTHSRVYGINIYDQANELFDAILAW